MSELNPLKGLQPSPFELCYMSELNRLKGSQPSPFELCYMSELNRLKGLGEGCDPFNRFNSDI
jgi:hypothetical protein